MSLLLLRADASPQIGMGHVMRCLALAEPWLQAGCTVCLLTASPSTAVRARTESLGISLRELTATPGSSADTIESILLAQSLGATWFVLDGYHFGVDFQSAVKAANFRLLVIDDTAHAANYTADLILNQNLGATARDYPCCGPRTHLLLGPRFVQLRSEFRTVGSSAQNRSNEIQASLNLQSVPALRILVTLGGSDPDNVTAKVISVLCTQTRISADIIIGPSNPHALTLLSAIHDAQSAFSIHQNPADLPVLMCRADLAICAGGTTAWELAFLGVPMLVLVIAENQRSNAERLAEAGAAIHTNLNSLASDLDSLLTDGLRRAELSRHALALVDGHGPLRVWLRMNEELLLLRAATIEDCRRVWEWANDPVVRAVSFNSEPISWDQHVGWFSHKLTETGSRMWIAEWIGNPVGQVRFDLTQSIATISISLDAAQRGKNLGTLIIWSACQRLFRESAVESIYAFIKPDNVGSIRAFTKSGFNRSGEVEVNGGFAIRFELERELIES